MLTNTHHFQVEFGDCDPAQLVYYPNYFAWFDRGTWHLLRSVGLDRSTLNSKYNVIGTPIVKAEANFKSAACDGDMLTIESLISRIGTHSFTLTHDIHRNGIQVTVGSETRVWTTRRSEDPLDIRATPIPDDVKAMFRGEK